MAWLDERGVGEETALPFMPEYPGMYIEEIDIAKSIKGVSTSTTAFVGAVSSGPTGVAIPVRSFAEYQRTFGGLDPASHIRYAVQQFFANGGVDAWIVGVPEGGTPADGLPRLDSVRGLAVLCLPGETDPGVLSAALKYADRRHAFLIIDPPGADPDAAMALARALAGSGSASGALYFPQVCISDPLDGGRERTCPPSGGVAGVYARTDRSRGVWTAPAGTEAVLLGIRDAEVHLGDDEISRLEAAGVSCIRTVPAVGPLVWGARTIQGTDEATSEWKFVPVRRVALFIEESLHQGTEWAVFDSNDEPLWAKLRLSAGVFLDALFRAGAFQGRTSGEAYFVRCDRSTMTQNDLDNGVVRLEVGFAPLKSAEFVIVQIAQQAARLATERLAPATGEPGLVLSLAHPPMGSGEFFVQVEGPRGWTMWSLVEELETSGPDDPVFTLDQEAGQIQFGDGLHGAIPPRGARLQAAYRYGSGRPGGAQDARSSR